MNRRNFVSSIAIAGLMYPLINGFLTDEIIYKHKVNPDFRINGVASESIEVYKNDISIGRIWQNSQSPFYYCCAIDNQHMNLTHRWSHIQGTHYRLSDCKTIQACKDLITLKVC